MIIQSSVIFKIINYNVIIDQDHDHPKKVIFKIKILPISAYTDGCCANAMLRPLRGIEVNFNLKWNKNLVLRMKSANISYYKQRALTPILSRNRGHSVKQNQSISSQCVWQNSKFSPTCTRHSLHYNAHGEIYF